MVVCHYDKMFKTKEQLLYFFTSKGIRLSTYDMKFCWNLQHMISKNNQVTTNQKLLFEKFIQKYRKQIITTGLNVDECNNLPWATKIVESEKKYTGAHVFLNNKKIIVKVPFNTKFIQSLRELDNHHLEWVRKDRHYVCPLSTISIKFLYENLHKYFSTVSFDSTIESYIKYAVNFESEIFNPTLVKVHDNYYIAAINSNLYEHIKDIEFNDNFKTLFLLSQYGVTIHEDIINNDKKKLFASSMLATVDIKDAEELALWLSELGVDKVYFYGRTLLDLVKSLNEANETDLSGPKIDRITNKLERHLKKLNIKSSNIGKFRSEDVQCPVVITSAIKSYRRLVNVFDDTTKRAWKYIEIADSTPIDIKVISI